MYTILIIYFSPLKQIHFVYTQVIIEQWEIFSVYIGFAKEDLLNNSKVCDYGDACGPGYLLQVLARASLWAFRVYPYRKYKKTI